MVDPNPERVRLAALRRLGLMDTPPVEELQGLVRLASKLLGCPIALVSLVDEARLWFQAGVGLEAGESPREGSYCDAALREEGDVFVVEDARQDARFASGPLIDQGLLAYAGRRIHAPGGETLGMLCAVDHQPRGFSPEQLESLRELATLAELAIARRASTRFQAERLTAFVKDVPAAVAYFDRDMRYLAVSRRWREDYGLGDVPLIGRSHYAVFPEIGEPWRASHRRTLAGEVESAPMDRFRRDSGSVDWVCWENRPWFGPEGEVGGLVMLTEVVTAEVRKARLLELRLAWLASPDAHDRVRLDADLTEVVADMLGGTGVRWLAPGASAGSPGALRLVLDHLQQPMGVLELDLGREPDASERAWLSELGQLVGEIRYRAIQSAELSAARQRHRSLFEASGGLLLVLSRSGEILDMNPAAASVLGASLGEVRGAEFASRYLAPASQAEFLRALATAAQPEGGSAQVDSRTRSAAGEREVVWTLRPWQVRPGEFAVVADGQDLTELRRLEARLGNAQRLEALGQLASGVAHDFNNMLSAMLGHLELAQSELPGDLPEVSSRLEKVRAAGESSAKLTAQLLAFGKARPLSAAVVDVNDVARRTGDLLERVLGRNVQLELHLTDEPCASRVNETQLEQALVNLAVNARDAMPEGGTVTLETSRVEVDAEAARANPLLEPNDYVLVAVSDTGCGMSPEVQARVFEPFFTTKSQGKGTGLGLAGVHGFVHQSGGVTLLYSEVGVGTSFKLYLPRVEEAAEEARAPVRPASGAQRPRTTARILVAEDNAMVRDLVCECLARDGYEVVSCDSGATALDALGDDPHAFDLLITDLVMPGTGGVALLDALHGTELRVLLMSGYAKQAIHARVVKSDRFSYLAKPIFPRQLRWKVAQLLGELEG